GAIVAGKLSIGYVGGVKLGGPLPWQFFPSGSDNLAGVEASSFEKKRKADLFVGKAKSEARAKKKGQDHQMSDLAAKTERDLQLRQKAHVEAESKSKTDEGAALRVTQVGQRFRDCNEGCPEMVAVPAGHFKDGGNSGARDVTIAQQFAVGVFP